MLRDTPTILLVDDEKRVLRALGRVLMDEKYCLLFADNPIEGLELLRSETVDLIICDYRLPALDGLTFLRRAEAIAPGAGRFLLTGYTDLQSLEAIFASGIVQQVLPKPWDNAELVTTIREYFVQRDQEKASVMGELIAAIKHLPTSPRIYTALRRLLADERQASLAAICRIVQQDPAVSVLLLKWANSPLFGQVRKVDSVQRAVSLLGVEFVSGLVLARELFDPADQSSDGGNQCPLAALQEHALACGVVGRHLLRRQGAAMGLADQAFTAGVVHDVGKLVLCQLAENRYRRCLKEAARRRRWLLAVEREMFRTDHAAIGGLLAARWNLPHFMVDVITAHHRPLVAEQSNPLVPTIQIADGLVHACQDASCRMEEEFGAEQRAALQLSDEEWQELLQLAREVLVVPGD